MGRVFDFLFPLECVACGAPGAHACGACLAAVPFAPRFKELEGLRVAAGFAYAQPMVRALLHDAKYEEWTCAAEPLAVLMRRWASKAGGLSAEALVTPVPLHAARERRRGFNQAKDLADAAAAALGAESGHGVLVRVRATDSQTVARDRRLNVAGAFACQASARAIRGRPILLVDDVVTSGATMAECAAALRRAGAGPIRGLALAWGNGLPNGDEKT